MGLNNFRVYFTIRRVLHERILIKVVLTRKHSSRMRTAHLLTWRGWCCCRGGGYCPGRRCCPGGEVLSRGSAV